MRTKNVVVEKWNPKWKDEFERIADSLGEDVIYNSIKIEHVGSTSVEGLSAKPIIDLDIVIENGDVLVFFPNDVHKPELDILDSENEEECENKKKIVTKVVFKIKI